MVQEGVEAGVFDRAEPRMVESVLAFDSRPVSDIMTPREKLVFLGRDDSHQAVWHKIVVSGHSCFPVHAGTRDQVVGMVSVKSLYANLAAGGSVRPADLMLAPLRVHEADTLKEVLQRFKDARNHVALVTGGEGRVVGMVTLVDVLEAIVGEIPTLEERLKPSARRRADGSWLVDGVLDWREFTGMLGVEAAPVPGGGDRPTVADFARVHLGPTPRDGDTFAWRAWRFEVADMDHDRIDKLLLLPAGFCGRPDGWPALPDNP